ncbi:MAG: site-2 protease family protein [Propionibacteriales bacterium]|nr:site-2 protease family protein [Propionibacteriales bacterium]
MTALVYTLGVVLFLLGVLASIALHEVGHMWPAKKFGVKVTQYFVGFGKTVWSVKRGDTEYGLKAIPLGGYIRMVGMLPPAKDTTGRRVFSSGFFGRMIADARAAEAQDADATDPSRHFYRQASWKKVVVMAGGPMTNVVLAVLLLSGVFMGIGVTEPTLTVTQISDCVIPAGEGSRACRVAPDPAPDPPSPAREAKLKVGDEILSLNGEAVASWDEFAADIRDLGGQRITIVVDRSGRHETLTATPIVAQRPDLDDPEAFVDVGFLGVVPAEMRNRQDAAYVAATLGDYVRRTGQAMLHMPERMTGVFKAALRLEQRDPESPMSVVGASRVAGEVASNHEISVSDRWAALLTLLGVVNLFVALFNFIPLLPLDGGHIAGALYEAARRGIARVRGRPDPGYADVAKMLPVAYTAAMVLIVMGVVLVWADIVNPIRISG